MVRENLLELTANHDSSNMKWYFENVGDCDKFKSVFEKNGYSIDWNFTKIVDASKVPPRSAAEAKKDPVQRALIAISWARNSYLTDKSTNISEEQHNLINYISMQKVEKDPEPVNFIDPPIHYNDIHPSDGSSDLGGVVCPMCHTACKITVDGDRTAHIEKCSCGYITDESVKHILERYGKS